MHEYDPYQYDELYKAVRYEDHTPLVESMDNIDLEDDPRYYDMDYLQLGYAASECNCTCCDIVEHWDRNLNMKSEGGNPEQLYPLESEENNFLLRFHTEDIVKDLRRVSKLMARPSADHYQLVWVEQDSRSFCDQIKTHKGCPKQQDLMLASISCMAGFSCPLPIISKDCTNGMPDAIMVAN